jgi:hypothetical protein
MLFDQQTSFHQELDKACHSEYASLQRGDTLSRKWRRFSPIVDCPFKNIEEEDGVIRHILVPSG